MRRHYRLILQAALSCSLFSCSAGRTQGVTYPEPSTVIADGLSDPFAILKDPASQVTSDYIEAENQNYRGWFERRSSLKRSILREMMKWTDRPFERPLELGRFVYFGESVPGLRFPIIKRRGLSASESRTVLDPNRLLAKNPEASLFAFKPSPAGEMIAFTIHFPQLGTEQLFVQHVESEAITSPPGNNPVSSLEWLDEHSLVFVEGLDGRPATVRFFDARSAASTEIFVEPDPRYFVKIYRNGNPHHIFIESADSTSSEVRVLNSGRAMRVSPPLAARIPGTHFKAGAMGAAHALLERNPFGSFLFTRVDGRDERWKLPPEMSAIDDFEVFEDFVAIYYRAAGSSRIGLFESKSGTLMKLLGAPQSNFVRALNPEYRASIFRYYISGYFHSPILAECKVSRRSASCPETGGASSDYVAESHFVPARDGEKIPVTVLFKSGIERPRKPGILHVYGAYGMDVDIHFTPARMALLDAGFVLAFAHVRGGAYYGISWHEAGRQLKKQNSINDVIDAAQYLQREKIVGQGSLSLVAKSAGALAAAAAINQSPRTFASAVLDSPFLDVLGSSLDPTQPLSAREFNEWGDPRDPDIRKYVAEYSPYQNVRRQVYPHLMIRAGRNDHIVKYYESLRYAAMLRHRKQGDSLLLVKIADHGEHAIAGDRQEGLELDAEAIAFLMRAGAED